MPAYKNKENGSWYVVTQYTDWTGERKPKCKRWFATMARSTGGSRSFNSRMFGVEGTDNLHFAVYAKQLGAGLDEQLEKFIREHPDTRLIIIDTLQKIREVSTDAYSYANDYDIVGRMKQFADKNGVCLLLVHHTRKQQAGDKFEMISGTTGLLGCADGAFLLQKEKRTDLNATLEIVGRDQPDQKLHLTRDAEKLTWQLDHAETELWKKPPDPLMSKLAAVIAGDTPVWSGSAQSS